jgi:hypothetical protein
MKTNVVVFTDQVSMKLSVDEQFLKAHSNTQSMVYKDFARNFCTEVNYQTYVAL